MVSVLEGSGEGLRRYEMKSSSPNDVLIRLYLIANSKRTNTHIYFDKKIQGPTNSLETRISIVGRHHRKEDETINGTTPIITKKRSIIQPQGTKTGAPKKRRSMQLRLLKEDLHRPSGKGS
ncbi:hypothetical protein QVD17_00772 [Tagetes erecta]|uniref:Uncharacterized protein n=1 Tax=Tagetes erecta TaxID=13708 RepID=A0AAD8P7I7_TARER|nr:hypothetical protein QVD17_00772 [Tagetes erecta]